MDDSLAYALADKVGALWSSELVQQKTMGMEPMEFRQFLATQLGGVLACYRGGKRARKGKPDSPGPVLSGGMDAHGEEGQVDERPIDSQITDSSARQLLENAPQEVREAYGKCRRNSVSPAAALDFALAMLRKAQEETAMTQVSA